jgi:hypothetical protein
MPVSLLSAKTGVGFRPDDVVMLGMLATVRASIK